MNIYQSFDYLLVSSKLFDCRVISIWFIFYLVAELVLRFILLVFHSLQQVLRNILPFLHSFLRNCTSLYLLPRSFLSFLTNSTLFLIFTFKVQIFEVLNFKLFVPDFLIEKCSFVLCSFVRLSCQNFHLFILFQLYQ
jgi:hypothetical protein